MSFRFVRVRDPRTKLEYGWRYVAKSELEVLLWAGSTMKVGACDVSPVLNEWITGQHATGNLSVFGGQVGHNLFLKWAEKNGKLDRLGRVPAAAVTEFFHDLRTRSKLDIVAGGHTLLIAESGSFMTLTDDMEILEELLQDNLEYPIKSREIRVIKWPNGIHWYAKVGSEDVQDEDGNVKWNTQKEAQRQAVAFIERTYNGIH